MTNDRNHRQDQPGPKVYPAEKARQGAIILRHKASRLIFIAGLGLIIVLVLVVYWF
jgi:hypothetical protein